MISEELLNQLGDESPIYPELQQIFQNYKEQQQRELLAAEWIKTNRDTLSAFSAEYAISNAFVEGIDGVTLLSEVKEYLKLVYICLKAGTNQVYEAAKEQQMFPASFNFSLYVSALICIKRIAVEYLVSEITDCVRESVDDLIEVISKEN